MSYLSYLCLFAYSGAQHIMCCVFVLFFFVLCTVLYDASFSGLSFVLLSLRLSLTFISYIQDVYVPIAPLVSSNCCCITTVSDCQQNGQ
jgi:hypothetical protein